MDFLALLFISLLVFASVLKLGEASCEITKHVCQLLRQIWIVWNRLLDALYTIYTAVWGVVGFLFRLAIFLVILALIYSWYASEEQKAVVNTVAQSAAPVAHAVVNQARHHLLNSNVTQSLADLSQQAMNRWKELQEQAINN